MPSAWAMALCEQAGAIATRIESIRPDGTLTLEGGIRTRLAGLAWPDSHEERAREALSATLREALAGHEISWKAATSPDRWGIAGIHLFVREPAATDAFWLQAGLVERGLAPIWPDGLTPDCLKQLETHEDRALGARRGYWAPRAQASRIRRIMQMPARHAGMKLGLVIDVASIRPWRALHFVNRAGEEGVGRRRLIGIAIPNAVVSELTKAGDNPRDWRNTRVMFRLVVPTEGLARVRIEHVTRMRKLPPALASGRSRS